MTTFHCYLCDNTSKALFELHKEACDIAGLDVRYHVFEVEKLSKAGLSPHEGHGWFMQQVLAQDESELIGFIDIDCIVATREFVDECCDAVQKSGTLLGLAQCANHLPSRDEVYAAPAFCIAANGIWQQVGSPSLIANSKYDTGQGLSAALAESGYFFDMLMPESHSNAGQAWPLADKGEYGIGTVYGGGKAFHLFQSSRGPSYIHLLEKQLESLRKGITQFA